MNATKLLQTLICFQNRILFLVNLFLTFQKFSSFSKEVRLYFLPLHSHKGLIC